MNLRTTTPVIRGGMDGKIYSELSTHKATIKLLLNNEDYLGVLNLLHSKTGSYMIDRSDYDMYFDIAPYSQEVSLYYRMPYLNASFVPVFEHPVIACQRPKSKYRERFETFILTVSPSVIVCLGRQPSYFKAEDLIQTQTIAHGNVPAICDETFLIKGATIRKITYLGWLDHSTIDQTELDFLIEYVDRHIGKHPEKTQIIHCKAGVGRTGTYIAYKKLLEYESLSMDDFIDVLIRLRSYRPMMVQSPDQLRFLYECFIKDRLSPG